MMKWLYTFNSGSQITIKVEVAKLTSSIYLNLKFTIICYNWLCCTLKDPAVSPPQLSCIFLMYLLLFCLFRKILKVVLFLWYFVELLRWKEFHLLQQMDQNWAWVANLSNSTISQVLRFLNWRGKLIGTSSTSTFNGCNFYWKEKKDSSAISFFFFFRLWRSKVVVTLYDNYHPR